MWKKDYLQRQRTSKHFQLLSTKAQICQVWHNVLIWGVNCSLNVTKEFLNLIPVKRYAAGLGIFQSLETCFEKHGLPWNRLVYLAADGAPAMCFSNVRAVGWVKNKLNCLKSDGINFVSVHCILHQEV